MLLPAKPPAPSSITPEAMADWSNPDFTITIPEYARVRYTESYRYDEALRALKKEAIARGYTVEEWQSMDTMCSYARFRRTGPAVVPPAPKLAIEETPVIDVEEVRDVRRIS